MERGMIEASSGKTGDRSRPDTDRVVVRCRSRRGFGVLLGTMAACVILIVWGNDRQPADPTEVLSLRGRAESPALPGPTIRLGTLNIHGFKGRDGVRDPARTAAALRDLDIVALQEVHSGWDELAGDQALQLGERLGMASLYAPFERRWWTNSFGTGLLTRVVPTSLLRIPLPGHDRNRFRNAVLMRFDHHGTPVNVLAVHLDNHQDHDHQLRTVVQLFLSLQQPAILLGDMNTGADDPQLQALLAEPSVTGHIDESSSGRQPLCGVDWIILRGLHCVRHEVRDLGASDHPALCAEVGILPEALSPPAVARN